MTAIFSKLKALGIPPEDFILFLQEALKDARAHQEIQNILLPSDEQIKLDIRLTRVERFIVHLEKERL